MSAAPMANASTASSSSTAAVARQTERRASSWTSAFGNARRKSSLNSSPFTLLVEAADQYVLHFEIFLDAVLGAFAAEAGLFHAAERRHLGGDDAGIRADDAGLHLLGDAEDAADVAAVEIAGQPEFGVIGEPDHLVLGLEADERRDGAERLLVGHDHVRCHVGDHRRLEEETPEGMSFPSQNDSRAFAEGVGDVR